MSDLIDAIIKTRKTAEQIVIKSLTNIDNASEVLVRERILALVKTHNELYPTGWYAPPPSGISVLFDTAPFKRLQFESLRNEESFPREESTFEKESVGIIYFSPVDVETNMIGDIGFTIYNGNNEKIKKHIDRCYHTTLAMAEHAKVGMKFKDLYSFSMDLFKQKLKIIGWMTTTSDPNLGINLGHTVPGSFESNLNFGNSFEDILKTIKNNRIYINNVEDFEIPETCALTVEARLADIDNPDLPNIFFHFIVVFNKGKKTILNNFENIFKIANMNYINLN